MKRHVVFLVLALVLACVALTLLVRADRQVRADAVRSLNTQQMILARQAAQGIRDFFDSQKQLLSVLAQDRHVVRLDDEGKAMLAELLAAGRGTLLAATRVGPDGRILYSFPNPEVAGRDISSQAHIAKMLAGHAPVVSDVFTAVQGYPGIALHVPVFDGQAFAGSLAVLIPFEVISRHYLQTIQVARSGYAFVVSAQGIELYCPVPGHMGHSIFENSKGFPEIAAMAQRMLRGEEGEASYDFDRVGEIQKENMRKHAVFTPVALDGTFWSICVTTPEYEVIEGTLAFRKTWGLMMAVLAVSGLMVFAYLGLAVFRARQERERRRAEAALALSETRFRLLFEDIPAVAVQGYDQDRIVVYWNEASTAFYGYAREEALGRRLEDLIIPEAMRPQVVESIRAWVEDNVPIPAGELGLLRKDGTIIQVYSSHTLQRLTDGTSILYCLDLDLTDLSRARSEMLRAKEAAETASRVKSEFLATMSHEIRTPLNGVLGMLQLMLTTELSPEQQKYAQVAIQSGRSLLRVLSDILDISRIEAGALRIEAEDFWLDEVFDPVAKSFEAQARAKGLDFASALDEELPGSLRGDAGRIRQVVYNLVGNALKYTSHGEVRLEAFVLPAPENGRVLLHLDVSDTGIGVPEAKIGSIFEAFTQVDGSYTRQYGGTGLGLTIVRRLVGLMGGEIEFCSQVGEGTDVHVVLPLAPAAASRPVPGRTDVRPDAGVSRLTVLLAEDDPVNLLTVTHMLTKSGHEVIHAKNGAEVLDILADRRVDCVLMDIQMPEMDGMEATRRIRAGAAGKAAREVPVIALTAHAMRGDREAFLGVGMDGYLAKPVDMNELTQVLGSVRRF